MRSERRKHIRVPGPFEAHRVGAPHLPVHLNDLSEGGCFVNTREAAPKAGEPCALQITFPGKETLTLTGETIYIREGLGFAVLFTDVPADTYARLERAIAALRQRK